MKYKTGEKVRVREDLIVGNQYNRSCLFTSDMDKHRGKVFSIIDVDSAYHRYKLDTGDNRSYSEKMLEPAEKKSCANCANLNSNALCCYECNDFNEWEEKEYSKPLEVAYFDNMKELSGNTEQIVKDYIDKIKESLEPSVLEKKLKSEIKAKEKIKDPKKVERLKKLMIEQLELYKIKNAKYGDSFGISVQKYGLISALTRMSDKWNRIENLIFNDDEGTDDESLRDSLIDLSAYALMTIIELEDMDE